MMLHHVPPMQHPYRPVLTISSAHSKPGRWLTASDTSTQPTTHNPHPTSHIPHPTSLPAPSGVSRLLPRGPFPIDHGPSCLPSPLRYTMRYLSSRQEEGNLPQKLMFWPTVVPSFDGFKLCLALPLCHPSSFLNPFRFSSSLFVHPSSIHTPIIH